MYQCNNCGGSLRFDIASQQLACEYCKSQYNPYEIDAAAPHGAEESVYDVTVFTCPQCGGELLCTDNSAAEFCSFCGASTILTSRLKSEKRPHHIIPFQKTKEDCKKAYQKLLRYAVFAPRELKDPDYIDSFRGIYMPYWSYHIAQRGSFSLQAEHVYRAGNYRITDTYRLTGDIDADFNGFVYDASASFSDDISASIAPYDICAAKPFTPAILSGFYADTADVDSRIYEPDAVTLANDYSFRRLSDCPEYRKLSFSRPSDFQLSSALCTDCEQVRSAMFPVWFLSYRKGDRVSYATVNGQTGKISADLPVDTRRYLLGSLLLAVPIYILLNLRFTIIPRTTLLLSAFLALAAAIIYVAELREINRRDRREDDIGYLSRTQGAAAAARRTKKKGPFTYLRGLFKGKSVVLLVIGSFFAIQMFQVVLVLSFSLRYVSLLLGMIVVAAVGFPTVKKLPVRRSWLELLCPLTAVLLDFLILYLDPASDLYFYGGTLFSYIMSCISLYAVICKYNLLATRPLPQLGRRGGEPHAHLE